MRGELAAPRVLALQEVARVDHRRVANVDAVRPDEVAEGQPESINFIIFTREKQQKKA